MEKRSQLTGLPSRYALLAGFAVLCLVRSASAAAVTVGSGDLDFTNCGGGLAEVNSTTITWTPPSGTVSNAGCIITGGNTDVSYSGGTLGPNTTGAIADLTLNQGSKDDFLTFTGSTLDFVLGSFQTYSGPTNCASIGVGQTCVVLAGSPFLLTNLGGGQTSISLVPLGTVTDGGVTSTWTGTLLYPVQ